MPRLTVTEYATLSVQLAATPTSVGALDTQCAVLRQARLTAEEWEEEVAYWEGELSRALDFEDQLPEVLVTYSTAVQAAQRGLSSIPVSLATFASVLAELRRGIQLDQALRHHHIALADFLTAQRRWLERAVTDPEIRHVLEASLR